MSASAKRGLGVELGFARLLLDAERVELGVEMAAMR